MTMLAGPRSFMKQSCRLLIVDDHPLSRRSTLIAFSVRGYDCAAAANPDEALTSIASFFPRIIIMEWVFRDQNLSGLGLAARFHRRAALLGIDLAIVVVSHAEQPPGFREREEVDAYFTKPVAPHVLCAAVDELAARQPRNAHA